MREEPLTPHNKRSSRSPAQPRGKPPLRWLAGALGAAFAIGFALGILPILIPGVIAIIVRKRLDAKAWLITALSAALTFLFSGVLVAIAAIRLLVWIMDFILVAVGLARP